MPIGSFLPKLVFTFMNVIRADKHGRSLYWCATMWILFLCCRDQVLHSVFGHSHRSCSNFPTFPFICIWPLGGDFTISLTMSLPQLHWLLIIPGHIAELLEMCWGCTQKQVLIKMSNDFYFFNSRHIHKVQLFIDCVINSLLFGLPLSWLTKYLIWWKRRFMNTLELSKMWLYWH